MKNTIIYISLLIFFSSLCSCSLKEAYTPISTEGTIEFIPRLTNFNNVNVSTKADDGIETYIHNAYLLLFSPQDKSLLSLTEINTEGDAYSQRIATNILTSKGLNSVIACYIANVPQTFVGGISSIDDLSTAVVNLQYLDTSIGVPILDNVPCIPMFGKEVINNITPGQAFEVQVTRLFAKVTLDIKLDLKDIGTLGRQRNTYFELASLKLCDLPQKVFLCTPDGAPDEVETIWDGDSYLEEITEAVNQQKIYNQAASGFGISKEYSISCYVPEYFLLPLSQVDSGLNTDQYGDQKYKPNLRGDKKAAYIKLIGRLVQPEGDPVGLEYDIYLGDNSTTSFTLERNKHYINNITITGLDNVEIDNRVTVTEGQDFINIYGQVANCYAISDVGDYTIKAYKGAFKYNQLKTAPKCTGTSVEIIAQDINGVTFENPTTPFVVEDEEGIKAIRFTVSEISEDCNIIIAIMKDGVVEWSWHLWFIKGLSYNNQGFFELTTQAMPGNTGYMLDRNLGVVTGSGFNKDWIAGAETGFYYRYGHRAPYFEPELIGNEKKYYRLNDADYSSWDVEGKAPSDPCPPGYKVPSKKVWPEQVENVAVRHDPFTNSLIYTTGIYYPYSGFIGSNNERQEDDTSNGKEQPPLSNIKIPDNQDNTRINRVTSKPNYDPIICSSINYKTIDIDKAGYLLTASSGSEGLLKYYYKEDGFELIKCTYIQGTWQEKPSFLGTYYVANYSNEQKNNSYTKTGEELKAENPDLYKAIMEGIKDETNGGFLGGIWDSITGFFETTAKPGWDTVNDMYGYQVRCVKE